MKTFILYFLLSFTLFPVFSQDTIFVNKHHFEGAVLNVLDAKGSIYVKTSNGTFQLTEEHWEPVEIRTSKPYLFYKNELFYESYFIPNTEVFDITSMIDLVPIKKGTLIATSAQSGAKFFVAIANSLFEYEIRNHYSKSYHTISIRDIFIEDSLKVISTYSGIFVNDSILLDYPKHSNGPLQKINSRYFLSWDGLSEFYPPDSIRNIPSGTSLFAGLARKVITHNKSMYALNTKSVCKILENFELDPIHQGLDYLDLEAFGNSLIFSTSQGICFQWTDGQADTLAVLPHRIKDIHIVGNQIFLASDGGVYELDSLRPESLKKIADTKNSVMTQLDYLGNFWIASEDGLYVLTKEYEKPILIIPDVEFNREALLLKDELLYVGAVDGLYTLDIYELAKSFIPNQINSLNIKKNIRKEYWEIGFFALIIAASTVFVMIYFNRAQGVGQLKGSAKEAWDLETIEKIIRTNNILTVDALADNLETNTVQLNRDFKKLGTTPGKFLKKIKLKEVQEYLKAGMPLEEISLKIGYSVKFLKNELNID